MAYAIRYYKDIQSHGHTWRVEFHQDTDEAVNAQEIGQVLQGLRLIVQGDQADIDTPIVKTSLEMVFVDAPDLETDRKCGYWEEFYTSSATEWKVVLYKDGQAEWTGFVTPDSFSEDLRYRGSVKIIVRDNIGTLQDTTCDLTSVQNVDGKVYVEDIILEAKRISTCEMEWKMNNEDFPYSSPGTYLISGLAPLQMLDTKRLSELNWWEALEKTLYCIGAVMRYVGGNRFRIVPLRDLPKMGCDTWEEVPRKQVQFLSYGHRELVPGVKGITEVHEFEINAEEDAEKIIDYSGRATRSCFNIKLTGPSGTTVGPNVNVPAWGYRNPKTNISVAAANSNLLNVEGYPKVEGEDSEAYGAWDDKSIMYYAVNTNNPSVGATTEYPLAFRRRVFASGTGTKVNISLTLGKPVTLTSTYSHVLNLPIKNVTAYGLAPQIYYDLVCIGSDRIPRYYSATNKSWGTSRPTNVFSPSGFASLFTADKPADIQQELKDITLPSTGILEITLSIRHIYIDTLEASLRYACAGVFLRLKDVRIDVQVPEDVKILDKITLNTNYSDRYAVRLTRSPEFAVCPSELPEVAYIPNAILKENDNGYTGADKWVWLNGADIDQSGIASLADNGISLSRLIHQQLLAYYAEPNNVLTGELLDKGGAFPDFCSLWEWNGKLHMLMSGSLNILTGRMEGATLRGFRKYSDMWETHVVGQDTWFLDNPQGIEQYVEIKVASRKKIEAEDIKMTGGLYLYGLTASASAATIVIACPPNFGATRTDTVIIDKTAKVSITRPAIV